MKRMFLAASMLLATTAFFPCRSHGEAWISMGPDGGSIKRLLQDPTNPNVIYIISGSYPSRMFKSIDKGSQWSEIALDFQINLNALEPNRKNPSEMFTCGGGLFARSTDSGATWSSIVVSGFNFYDLIPDSTDQNILHGCGYDWNSVTQIASIAYFKSTNKGADWSKSVIPSLERAYAYAVAPDPKNSRHVWIGGLEQIGGVTGAKLCRSTNGGTSWTDMTGTITGTVQDIFIDSTDVKRILVVTSANTFRSTDNGASWQPCSGFPSGNRVTQDPKNRNTFYIAGFNKAYKSTDGGVKWSAYSNGLTGGTGYDIAVDRSASDNLFGAYDFGFYKSTNGSANWNPSNAGLALSNVTAVKLIGGSAPALLAAYFNDGLYKTLQPLGKVHQSQTVGWTRLPTFYDCHNLTDLLVSPADPKVLYAFEGGG